MAIQYTGPTTYNCYLTSLASGAARSSVSIATDTTKNVVDALVSVSIVTTATAPSGNKQYTVYGYLTGATTAGAFNGSDTSPDNVDGTDKLITLGSPTNLVFLGTIQANQGAAAVGLRGVFSVRQAFGCMPAHWGVVVVNDSGTAASASSPSTISVTQVYYT